MKKHIVGVFGLATARGSFRDAQITQTTRVLVPFPFVAAGRSMPGADYSVTITKDTGLIHPKLTRSLGDSAQHQKCSPRQGILRVLPEVHALRQ